MLNEYDFSNGIRGKYAQAYKEGVTIVRLDTNKKSVGVTMSHDKTKLTQFNIIYLDYRKESYNKEINTNGE